MSASIMARIVSSRAKYETVFPKAKSVMLNPDDYRMLHAQAEDAGFSAPYIPETEDERLEFQGMRVYQHTSQSISFSS